MKQFKMKRHRGIKAERHRGTEASRRRDKLRHKVELIPSIAHRLSPIAYSLVLLLLFSSAAWCAETPGTKGSWNDYKVVSQRNIFSRNRLSTEAVQAAKAKQTPTVTQSEQSYLVLRGVVRENDIYTAFIENSGTGEVKKVHVGDSIGGGTISAATLDYISFDLKGANTRVEIGMTLEGKISQGSAAQYYSGGGSYSEQGTFDSQQSVQPAVQSTVSDDKAKDILQRLKERRKKELGE